MAARGMAITVIVVAAIVLLATATGNAADCPLARQQFNVVVPTAAPLGLRLGARLEILAFAADADGRPRAVEASGLAEVGDMLLTVNGESLVGLPLHDAVDRLANAPVPRTLRFQTGDGRCLPDTSGQAEEVERFDYVLLSVGDRATEMRLFAVLSRDGVPPSCAFRTLVVADPPDACSPLTTNVTDAYVIVPNLPGCPTHQKASLIQEAGGSGVIFVAEPGAKPNYVRLPPASDLPLPIRLPLAMVSQTSGDRAIARLDSTPPSQMLQVRFVFSAECGADKFATHPATDDLLGQSIAASVAAANAGFVAVSVASSAAKTISTVAYEFLKPDGRVQFVIGKQDLVVADDAHFDACETDPDQRSPLLRTLQTELHGAVALATLRRECGLAVQLGFFAEIRFAGVIFADSAFPTFAHSFEALVDADIPFAFISDDAHQAIMAQVDHDAGESDGHVQVEFTGENALNHHWWDLANLADPINWPSTTAARKRLYHRMLKDQAAVVDQDLQHALASNERQAALDAALAVANRFYDRRKVPAASSVTDRPDLDDRHGL